MPTGGSYILSGIQADWRCLSIIGNHHLKHLYHASWLWHRWSSTLCNWLSGTGYHRSFPTAHSKIHFLPSKYQTSMSCYWVCVDSREESNEASSDWAYGQPSSGSREQATLRINKIDKEFDECMRNAEGKCWQIKSGRIPFSPEAALLLKRTQVYQSLLKYQDGRIKNRGNLKQAAWRCGIEDTISISQGEIKACLRTCIKKCEHYWMHGQSYRWTHLQSCLAAPKKKED